MGSGFSSAAASARDRDAENVISESETMNSNGGLDTDDSNEEFHDAADELQARVKAKEEEMEEFKKQLSIKREQRKEILTRHRNEKQALEKSLQEERSSKEKLYEHNQQLRELLRENNISIPENVQTTSDTSEFRGVIHEMREGFEELKIDNHKLRREMDEANSSLQSAYSDMADLTAQNMECIKHISALKDVVAVSKTMITLREEQLTELKNKLSEIEKSLSDREANMLSNALKQEYERQLQNIRSLRALYEERSRIAELTRLGLVRDLAEQKDLVQTEVQKNKELTDKVNELEDVIKNKNSEISTSQDETKGTKAEMTVVNKLFSQVLLGYKTKQDLDKLVHRLEENHGLLTHMAGNENDAEASSALPKLLLELVSEVDDIEEKKSDEQESKGSDESVQATETPPTTSTAKEIVENLPKVWRVLMELLSHQAVAEDSTEKVTTCYKLVQTKLGPVEVPSVSQTYIRLKDLIVEKLGLVKEVNQMKQLNSHLENRLQEQEKRLCLVTTELGKTWHVVSKLKRHHYQLHTHEKILKYELQQKRKLLNELKEELEYCREKWDEARAKNLQSERDWKKLRADFTSRKIKAGSPSFNNSGESGYSDERPSEESSESNDESEYVSEPPHRCKKKMKKSFETILDSSNDFNCAAEREDPVSDMLDVADLPLDAHETDNHGATISERSASENLHGHEKTCETEDEICDITHDDSVVEEIDNESKLSILGDPVNISEGTTNQTEPGTFSLNTPFNVPLFEENSVAIVEEILESNQVSQGMNTLDSNIHIQPTMTLSNDDTGLRTSEALIELVASNLNEDINSREETSNDLSAIIGNNGEVSLTSTLNEGVNFRKEPSNELSETNGDDEEATTSTVNTENNTDENNTNTISETPTVDFKSIMESVKRQNERLAKKDERLDNLDKGCCNVVTNLTSTLNSGENIIKKLDSLHKDHMDSVEASGSNCLPDRDSEPSSSTDVDHEARFAARDIRLARLEEQTKSLVNKVNKTNSKGVKIHYKLQELHNIYGSETSRAGTPSEENADRSNDEDNDQSESIEEDPDSNNN